MAGMGCELVGQGLGQAEPDRVRQPLGDQPVQELVGGAGAVDPDQDLPAGPVPGPVRRQLAQRGPDDGEVVGGGVGAGVARAQQRRQRLTGAGGAVVDERPQRVDARTLS